jgi:hypothetical protein
MSTETHVFFRGRLPTKAALSRAMKELGFPFAIKPATGSLEEQSGFMPMMLRREETGVEFGVYDHSAVEEFADVGVDASFERLASFRWGGDFQEAVAGMCAAAALAKLTNGVVFDEAEDRLLSVEDAIAVARKNLKELPEPPKQRMPRGPTALKRILAPLLAKRSELVLAHRLLLIRPVRHLMRGAEFEWSDHGTKCSARPFIRPLYQPSRLFLNDAVFSADVQHPDFAPMLFDRLAVEVFEPLGKIATIEDFIGSSWGKRLWLDELIHSILLSRGLDEAKTLAATIDTACKRSLAECKARLGAANRKDAEEMYHRRSELKSAEEGIERSKERHALLARGEAAVFEHYRSWEAEVARGHKIEQAWEPSPFPVQLPASQRAAKSADPKFAPTPWPDFPTTWRQDPPETPGEIRFAGHWWYRQGRLELLHPITREQAETRYRNFEHYVLATRLTAAQVLILARSASSMGEHLHFVRYILWIYDSQGQRMIADFQEDHDDPGILKMRSIDIKGGRSWHSYLNFKQGEKSIHDYRLGEKSYACRPMTDEDRSLYAFRLPDFGELDDLWQRVSTYLSNEGFGVFA